MFTLSDSLLWLHGKTRASGAFAGSTLCSSASEATELYLDEGKTYSDLSGQVGWGVHILITTTFTTLTGFLFEVVHNSSAPTTENVIGGRYFTAAQLVAGKHYFIPFYAKQILRYLGGYAVLDGSAAGAGKLCAWVGPGPDGAE